MAMLKSTESCSVSKAFLEARLSLLPSLLGGTRLYSCQYSGCILEGQIPETSRKYLSSVNSDLKAIISDFMEWLSKMENKHWLIIFNNIDCNYYISNYIPEVDHRSILITTWLANLQ
ncbi:hypothetical protein DPV78_000271 [Talaromyces pinophilus]|nr:hypothetical protein DPV78_000271 [Talaromyces pinophilus]